MRRWLAALPFVLSAIACGGDADVVASPGTAADSLRAVVTANASATWTNEPFAHTFGQQVIDADGCRLTFALSTTAAEGGESRYRASDTVVVDFANVHPARLVAPWPDSPLWVVFVESRAGSGDFDSRTASWLAGATADSSQQVRSPGMHLVFATQAAAQSAGRAVEALAEGCGGV